MSTASSSSLSRIPRIINGPAGDLEILFELPDPAQPNAPVIVVCHPHPLYGGSLHNKVVHIIAKTCRELGYPVMRFNFRGVGKSAGQFDHGLGEQQDCLAVVEWLRQQHPDRPVWLAGFSFGSFVAYQVFRRAAADRLLLVAPPVGLFQFERLDDIAVPWWVIQGQEDEITPPASVRAWVEQQAHPPEFHYLQGVSHFFHGKLNVLREILIQIWSE